MPTLAEIINEALGKTLPPQSKTAEEKPVEVNAYQLSEKLAQVGQRLVKLAEAVDFKGTLDEMESMLDKPMDITRNKVYELNASIASSILPPAKTIERVEIPTPDDLLSSGVARKLLG
jgi:hypothetical protein